MLHNEKKIQIRHCDIEQVDNQITQIYTQQALIKVKEVELEDAKQELFDLEEREQQIKKTKRMLLNTLDCLR